MTLQSWAEDHQQKMLEMWDANFRDSFPHGFQLTSSPVEQDPSLLIMGYNPGIGTQIESTPHPYMNRFLAEDGSTRTNIEYGFREEPWCAERRSGKPANTRLHDYVCSGKSELLESCIETNRYVLRTRRSRHHADRLEELEASNNGAVSQYKEFCRNWIRDLINKTSPEMVLSYTGNRGRSPMVEFEQDYGFNPEIIKKYVFEDHDPNRGNVETVQVKIVHADLGPCEAIGVEPHLSDRPFPKELLKAIEFTVPNLLPTV